MDFGKEKIQTYFPKPIRLTVRSFLEYSEVLLDSKKDFDKIKEYVGDKEELLYDDAMAFLQTFLNVQKTRSCLSTECPSVHSPANAQKSPAAA